MIALRVGGDHRVGGERLHGLATRCRQPRRQRRVVQQAPDVRRSAPASQRNSSPFVPSAIRSRITPTGVVTTGTPHAIASTVTRGPPSTVEAQTSIRAQL